MKEVFLNYVKDITTKTSKSSMEQGLSSLETIKMIKYNIRKFIDYMSAFMEIEVSILDSIIEIFPDFISEKELLLQPIRVDGKPVVKRLVNTGNTNYSLYYASSSCGSSNSSSRCGGESSSCGGFSRSSIYNRSSSSCGGSNSSSCGSSSSSC